MDNSDVGETQAGPTMQPYSPPPSPTQEPLYSYRDDPEDSEPAPLYQLDEDRLGDQPEVFHNSLFSCFDSLGSCCLGTCCTMLSFGRSSLYLRLRDSHALPEPRAFTTFVNTFSITYFLANYLTFNIGGPVLATYRRGQLRHKYGIKGSIGEDIATHFCCHCCALIQEDREVLLREVERRKVFGQQQALLADDL